LWGNVQHCVTKGRRVEETSPLLEKEIRGQGIFVSNFVHSLDSKRRLTIPSEWRAQVGSPKRLSVLPDVHQKCLCVFPASQMVERLNRIKQHSIADSRARQFARILASQSDLVSWDAQGRIRVKDELLDFAELKDQVAMLGAFDSFELWNPENLEAAGGMNRDQVQEAAKYVGF